MPLHKGCTALTHADNCVKKYKISGTLLTTIHPTTHAAGNFTLYGTACNRAPELFRLLYTLRCAAS